MAAAGEPAVTGASGLCVLVVDDEPLARRRITALLAHRPEVEAVREAGDGDAALAALDVDRVDVVFLDVQMPGRDGLAVARALGPDRLPAVVFVTAFDHYAVAAFDLAAVDYLLKPFDDARFHEAFARACRRLAGDALAAQRDRLAAILSHLPAAVPAGGQVTVEKGGRLILLPWADIDWVRAADNYVEIHARGEQFLARATLTRAAEQLPSPPFLRTHRAVLVNADRIAHIEPSSGEHVVVLRDGTRLPLSRRYRRRLPTLAP
jgi:two-component system LytT family response regulator